MPENLITPTLTNNWYAEQRRNILNNRTGLNPLSSRIYADRIVSNAQNEAFTRLGLNVRSPLTRLQDGYFGTIATLSLGHYRDVIRRIAKNPANHLPHITASFKHAIEGYLPEHKSALDEAVSEILKLPLPIREAINALPFADFATNLLVYTFDAKHGMSRRRATVEGILTLFSAFDLPALIAAPDDTHRAFEIHGSVISQSVLDMANDVFRNPKSPLKNKKSVFANAVNTVMDAKIDGSTVYDELGKRYENLANQEGELNDQIDKLKIQQPDDIREKIRRALVNNRQIQLYSLGLKRNQIRLQLKNLDDILFLAREARNYQLASNTPVPQKVVYS